MSSSDIVVPAWINGREESLKSSFNVISPHTGKACWRAAAATTSDAIRAVEAAQAAFATWSKTKPGARQKILMKAADLLEARTAEYGEFMQTEMGAHMSVTNFWVLPTAVSMLRDIASHIPAVCSSGSVPTVQEDGMSAMVWKEPYGVILGITPWNAPYALGARAVGTAIATGNTTILKGSELTPRCNWALAQVFADAGLPSGVLNVLSCEASKAPEVVAAMIEHPAVRKVNFTGSTNTGRAIARSCGQNLKPSLMELGGKNSAIVLADADLEKAAKEVLAGSFLNSGQICMSTDRLIIQASVEDQFLAALRKGLAAMAGFLPPPVLISSTSKAKLQSLVDKALSNGAYNILSDGKTPPNGEGGTKFMPMIIGNVNDKMDIWQQESFGPVVAYVTAASEDEAIEIANKTDYGLSAAVFSRDLRKAFAVARRLQSGAVHINSMTVHDEAALPHGGVKNSGWGRFNTQSGMEEFVVTKSVTWDD